MQSKLSRFLVTAALLIGSVVMLFPLWWMFVVSLSSPGDAAASANVESLRLWPREWNWHNYPDAVMRIGSGRAADEPASASFSPSDAFKDALANTIVITVLSVLGQVLSCSLVGYGFARLRFRGRDAAFLVMLSTMMLPFQVTMIPTFLMFRWLGWIDTPLPLIVPMFFGSPFYIFMFRQFFAQVPEALVEAARLDGCGYLGVWWRIMLPLCKPVVAITAAFTFIFVWNDFLGPLIFLNSEEQRTLAIALSAFKNQYGDFRDVHYLMAISILTMLPCVVLFFVAQKQFVGGLSVGAVKG